MTPQKSLAVLDRPAVKKSVADLRREYENGRLTLYLGAGVSMASGLPSWSTLLATLYYIVVKSDWASSWKPFPNYLYALGEWWLKQSGEAPEVIAGKVRNYPTLAPGDFHQKLIDTLYLPWKEVAGLPSAQQLRATNDLLRSIAELCRRTRADRGLHAVVTTNYDSLLERSLSDKKMPMKFNPIWRKDMTLDSRAERGIFHVHGYLPHDDTGSREGEILLTESQYHEAASDPYSWSNLTLIQCFSSSTGLMLGMSMTDRNLRRLLHALSQTQLRRDVYIVLKRPEAPTMSHCDIESVGKKAKDYIDRFPEYGIKKGVKAVEEMQDILRELVDQEQLMAESALKKLGVTIIWVKNYSEVPVIVDALRDKPRALPPRAARGA